MKVRTPEISWFARKAIMSLDFQHDSLSKELNGFRMATSALPDDDKYIRLWKLAFENGNADSKMDISYLCSMGCHQSVVNVVKFSPIDQLLAAGDSDGFMVVWKFKEITPRTMPDIFSADGEDDEEEKPLEKWFPFRRIGIHVPGKDVLDLCWSTDGTRIISCSIDYTVVTYDVETNTKLNVFHEHESRHPLGIAWDPQSEYFATLSNSRTLNVYDALNSQRLHKVTKATISSLKDPETEISSKIFHDDTLFSFSRRLCWSPCGELLFCPAGVIEEGAESINAAYIFTRWSLTKPAIALTSLKERPLSVRCCPTVFELRQTEESNVFDLPYRIVIAVMTKVSVIFYDTQSCEPFAYVSHFQYGATLDMAWTPDGRCLTISAEEGYCTFIRFEENELGIPMDIIPKPPPPPEPMEPLDPMPPLPPTEDPESSPIAMETSSPPELPSSPPPPPIPIVAASSQIFAVQSQSITIQQQSPLSKWIQRNSN